MSRVRVKPFLRGLFWRLFLSNALVFVVGALVLAFSPATGAQVPLGAELAILVGALVLILAVNAVLVRAVLSPLDELAAVMRRVRLARGDRVAARGRGDFTALLGAFNDMLDRLGSEHSHSSARVLAAQERERRRIAQELHDEIGQGLTVALLGLKRVVAQTPGELHEEALMAQDMVRSSLEEVRRVAHRLRPDVLADLGLASALQSLSSEFSAGGLEVRASVDPRLPELSEDVELVLYRVAQESLTNVARHAHAGQADVMVAAAAGVVTLRVADDGRGGPIQEGTGITGMRERAMLVGAHLEVRSAPGGTEVFLSVPAEAAQAVAGTGGRGGE